MNEADTGRKQVVPLLQAAGWDDEPHDHKNPRAREDITHRPPEELAASILEKERRIAEIMERIQKLLARSAES